MLYFYTNQSQTLLRVSDGPLMGFSSLGCCADENSFFDPEDVSEVWIPLTPVLRQMVKNTHKIYLRRGLGQGLTGEDVRWLLTKDAGSVDFLSSWAGEGILTEDQKTEWVQNILIPAMYVSVDLTYVKGTEVEQIRQDLSIYFYFKGLSNKDGPHDWRFFNTLHQKETIKLLRELAPPSAFADQVQAFLAQVFPMGYTFNQTILLKEAL